MKPPPFTGRGLRGVYARLRDRLARRHRVARDGERRQLEVVAATFKQGCVELDQLRQDGWREMHIIVGRT